MRVPVNVRSVANIAASQMYTKLTSTSTSGHETTRPDESDLPLESLGECRTGQRYAGLWDRLSDNHEWHEEAKGATTVSHFLKSQIRWVAHVRAPRMARSHLLLPFKLYARQA